MWLFYALSIGLLFPIGNHRSNRRGIYFRHDFFCVLRILFDLMMIRFATRFTYKRFKTEIARFLCMIFQNVIFLAFIRTEFARTIFTFQKRLFYVYSVMLDKSLLHFERSSTLFTYIFRFPLVGQHHCRVPDKEWSFQDGGL